MPQQTIRFADLTVGDHFIHDDMHLVKRELRKMAKDALPLNACAPDGYRPWLFIGADILVSKTP